MPPETEFPDAFPHQRITAIKNPDASPLVSIICRTMNRESLRDAVISVNEQSWPNIELLLVDATGLSPGLPPELSAELNIAHRVISSGEAMDRPTAANAGLHAAQGDYLLFLDDDDWIAPSHIEALVSALTNQTECTAAYSNVRVTHPDGSLTNTVFDQAYDPVLLRRDNYLPIHAVLFSNQLLALGCRFDETLTIYEDWDFWLQCSAHTDFLHIASETAFYRQGGESATALTIEKDKYKADTIQGKARITILNKWLPSWNGTDLNHLLGTMDNSEALHNMEVTLADASTYVHKLETDIGATNEQLHVAQLNNSELHISLGLVTNERNILKDEFKTLKDEFKTLKKERNYLVHEQQELLTIQAALQEELHGIYQSRSWRMTRPYRWIGRQVKRIIGSHT